MPHHLVVERQRVERFLQTVSYDAIRAVDRPHDVRLPDGRLLRGVLLSSNIYIARDRKFYRNVDGQAIEVPLAEALREVDSSIIFVRLRNASAKAKARRARYRRQRAS